MLKVNNKSNRRSGVFIVNVEYIWHVSGEFFASLNMYMPNEILYCLNLNLSICFRAGSRSPVAFKTKLSVTTVSNSFQLFPIFCHKELHLRCCKVLKLKIAEFTKNLKGIVRHPHDRVQTWDNLKNLFS